MRLVWITSVRRPGLVRLVVTRRHHRIFRQVFGCSIVVVPPPPHGTAPPTHQIFLSADDESKTTTTTMVANVEMTTATTHDRDIV